MFTTNYERELDMDAVLDTVPVSRHRTASGIGNVERVLDSMLDEGDILAAAAEARVSSRWRP